MTTPYLTIDLDKIEHNARTLVGLCTAHGIQVSGVTKCVCGEPAVAAAMLRGGVMSIADSRLQNIHRLRSAGIHQANMLIRLPALSQTDQVVGSVDTSLNSELTVLEALSAAATRRGTVHRVMPMVDLGDLREGVMPEVLIPLTEAAARLPGIRVVGLASNLGCFAGVIPTAENMQQLVDLAAEVAQVLDRTLDWVSGANSSALDLIAAGGMPAGINHARIGEAILLGRETTARRPWPGTFQDAFVLHAEVLELQTKPSLPVGVGGEDAFGRRRAFDDRGPMRRALLNVGREDVAIDGIVPLDEGLEILGASSGYLVVDASRAARKPRVGDELRFSLNYAALLAAMTSGYVQRQPLRGNVATGVDA